MFAPKAVSPPSWKIKHWAVKTTAITIAPAYGPSKTAARTPPNKCPEVPPITGKFSIHELHINWRQNFASGFFGDIHLPIRSMEIKDIGFIDRSPATGSFSQQTAEWIRVKNNLNALLSDYGINAYNTKWEETDTGDLSLYLGWQHVDYESFDFLKFLSTTIRAGLLFPTGSKDETNYAFSLPNGYNGHWGIPVRFDLSVGASHWLTIGAHVGSTFFFDQTFNRRMKTHIKQNGWIKLAEGKAKVDKGTLWDIGGFVKFDHFVEGLSAMIGYTFNAREDDELSPRDKNTFPDDSIVNSDSVLKSWHSHVIHLLAEYDFGVHMEDSNWAPHLGLFYDFPVDGEKIFDTDMIGGNLGFHFMWKF